MITQFTDVHVYQQDGTFKNHLAIENGMIVESFQKKEKKEKKEKIQTVSLQGKYLFPTFEDCHNHPSGMCLANQHIDLENISSLEKLEALLKQKITKQSSTPLSNEESSFIVGVRWNSSKNPLNATLLDQISTTSPIIIVDQSYHRAYSNTLAFECLKIPQNFPGNLGEGILEEQAWIEFAWPKLYINPKQMEQGLLNFQKLLLQHGFGAVHDLYLGNLLHLDIYQKLIKKESWKLPLEVYLSPHLLEEKRDFSKFPFIRGMKLFLDGSFSCHTACLREPYEDHDEHCGMLWWKLPELKRRVRLAVDNQLEQVAIHVIGDKSIDVATELIEWASQEFGEKPHFRLEHVSLIYPDQLKKLVELRNKPSFSIQPNFIKGDQEFRDRLGKRLDAIIPLALYTELQAQVGFGTDYMPMDPWYGIQSTAESSNVQQSISLTKAIEYYTIGSASLVGKDSQRGGLSIGKEANFWLTSKNPLQTPSLPEEVFLKGTSVYSISNG